jgi:hypothetical protein
VPLLLLLHRNFDARAPPPEVRGPGRPPLGLGQTSTAKWNTKKLGNLKKYYIILYLSSTNYYMSLVYGWGPSPMGSRCLQPRFFRLWSPYNWTIETAGTTHMYRPRTCIPCSFKISASLHHTAAENSVTYIRLYAHILQC